MIASFSVDTAHKPLMAGERDKLLRALMANADRGKAIIMNPKDTSFVGVVDDAHDVVLVVDAIQDVPTHY